MMQRLSAGLALAAGLLSSGAAHAGSYLAGWSAPQNNTWGEKVESTTPPVSYFRQYSDFWGFRQHEANASPGLIRARTRSSFQPGRYMTYAQFTLNDVVFSCTDGRSELSYRMRLRLKADIVHERAIQGSSRYSVGDATCPWGSCSNHWGTWTSTSGGLGIAPGGSFDVVYTGPVRTASTGTPVTIAVSVGTEMGFRDQTLAGVSEIDGSATFPSHAEGPVFELPEGCTCNSNEGKIFQNQWDPERTAIESRTWGAIKNVYR